MTDEILVIFVILVFLSVIMVSQIIVIPSFGTNRADSKRLRQRLQGLSENHAGETKSLVKEKYLTQLSPMARWIESFPLVSRLSDLLDQAGKKTPAHKFVMIIMLLALILGYSTWVISNDLVIVLPVVISVFIIPLLLLYRERNRRIDKFEEQLPEALDMMIRALQTGYFFNECMLMISQEMDAPIAEEFGITFEEINYGKDIKSAFELLIGRMPSVSLIAMVTSIMIQNETGGNLSEALEKISAVLRGRFKIQRRVKSLSAEGRISAWVLAMMPFAMFVVLNFMQPGYYDPLYGHPDGMNVFIGLFVMQLLGAFWVRKILNIDI